MSLWNPFNIYYSPDTSGGGDASKNAKRMANETSTIIANLEAKKQLAEMEATLAAQAGLRWDAEQKNADAQQATIDKQKEYLALVLKGEPELQSRLTAMDKEIKLLEKKADRTAAETINLRQLETAHKGL